MTIDRSTADRTSFALDQIGKSLQGSDFSAEYLLESLPTAVYVTNAAGHITFFNQAAVEFWGRTPELGKSEFCGSWKLYWPDGTPLPHAECPMALALKLQRPIRGVEAVAERPDGSRVPFLPFPTPLFDESGALIGAINMLVDISQRKQGEEILLQQRRRLETLNRVARIVSSDLDLDRIVQDVTDAATDLCGAKFGAFFYNAVSDGGERYTLYALSGVQREAFEAFGLPRNPTLFDPTFRGAGTIRSDDIRSDPRYGKNSPHFEMPETHLPVVSYMAVPVISRSGEVHGGLFFGHDLAGAFSVEAENTIAAIASQAGVAIDNARLLQTARLELVARRSSEQAAQRLAAIVESTDDAILTKNLDGIITSWNQGAEKLFGYTETEAVGMPVVMLIPEERADEEPNILGRIRKGERIDHYETVRRRKDGSLVEISLTVSPLREQNGRIVGASKIARDITERQMARERQTLLLREMNHRVKNLFAVAGGVVSLSARTAGSSTELATAIRDRLGALAKAHNMTLPNLDDKDLIVSGSISLRELLQALLAPYDQVDASEESRIEIRGADVSVSGGALTGLSLVLHEFATNAAKYGALSSSEGHILVVTATENHELQLKWTESGGPQIVEVISHKGFGATLERAIVEGQLRGHLTRDWSPDGLIIHLAIPLASLEQ